MTAAPYVRPRVQSTAESVGFERPYPPGWLDRLIDWIDRAPGPNALYLIGLLLAQAMYVTGLLWWNEKLPVGEVDPARLFFVVVVPYLLWVRFNLDRVACAALENFRPALTVDEGELQRLRYELTTLPARTSRAVTAVAVIAFAVTGPGRPRGCSSNTLRRFRPHCSPWVRSGSSHSPWAP